MGVGAKAGVVVSPCGQYAGLASDRDDESHDASAMAGSKEEGTWGERQEAMIVTYASTYDGSHDGDSASSLDERTFKEDGHTLLNDVQEASQPISALRWGLMTLVMYIYALINTSMALYVLPVESRRMHPGSGGSVWVSVCIAVCGSSQLINPIVGRLSDRHVSPLGRRRPFIILGAVVAILGFCGLWGSSVYSKPLAYQASLFLAEIGLNLAFSAQCGLPADIQGEISGRLLDGELTEEQSAARGTSSGVIALQSVLGSLSAVAMMVATRNMEVQVQYPLYISGILLCCAAVCKFSPERPTHGGSKPQTLAWSELKESFMIDTDEDADFFWVCLGRMCYYVVTSMMVFQMYYLQDMLNMVDLVDREVHLCIMVVTAQGIGIMSSVPFGKWSNTLGRKALIYAACVVMIVAAICQIVAPKIGSHGSWPMVWLCAALAGLGNSAYLSVDYALALDCMPRGKTTAEAFGLWGIAGFAGSTIGPLFGGVLLTVTASGGVGQEQYTYVGYASCIFGLGIFANILVMCCTFKIKLAS